MRILMLGNSFTYYNNMPDMLAELVHAEVTTHARGGAWLSEQLDPDTEIGAKTLAALSGESWDYVVLQEYSNGPVVAKKEFLESVSALCEKAKEAGAVPVLYATWAYERDSADMTVMGISYDTMYALLSDAYREATEQNDALLAEVGKEFYELSESLDLYDEDGCHPSKEGSELAAKTIAAVILQDQLKKLKAERSRLMSRTHANDGRLRLLYLYQIFQKHTDAEHPLTTNEIRNLMEKKYGIPMHRTTVASDVDLLLAAGIPINVYRSRANKYYLEEGSFEIPELKILIDAVESSKFITEKKSQLLVKKLMSLTSEANASKLRRNLHTSGRARSGNEKGYYIVDAINEAINTGKKISLFYTDWDEIKSTVLRNDGKPYTVSPYTLIWNGDYYYLVGYYHEKERVSTFRTDRILAQPEILKEDAMPAPADFDIGRYTKEVFRMYDMEELKDVTLLCENSVMKGVIDQFGQDIAVHKADENHFRIKVSVCTSPTFYSWVFQWEGRVRILEPAETAEGYRVMLEKAL